MKFERSLCPAVAMAIASLAACSAGSASSPSSVENKAVKLLADSEKAIPSVPVGMLADNRWQSCGEETPGDKQFLYMRSMQLTVDKADQQSVAEQIAAGWKKAGYWLRAPDPSDPSVVAKTTSDGSWTLTALLAKDGRMFLTVDSGCVQVSPSPKTG